MKVYAIGNLTLDIIINPVIDKLPWGIEMTVDNLSYRTAGNLSNVIIPLKKVMVDPIVMGNIGNDENGKKILRDLNNIGLKTTLIDINKEEITSVTVALVREDGERTFLTYPGQLKYVDKNFLNKSLRKIENNSIVILCSLFQFPNLKINDVIYFFKKLKELNCITLLDTGWDPHDWGIDTISDIKKLLNHTDIFLPNLEEARSITKTNDELKIINTLIGAGAKNIIIKKGSKGSLSVFNRNIIETRPYVTSCVDTTGAGDAFNAYIVYSLSENIPYYKMLEIANAGASYVVSRLKNRYPTLNDINNIIK